MPMFKFEFYGSYRGVISVDSETEQEAADTLRAMSEDELSPYIQRYDFEADPL